jgi:riboflavin kinase/FMN adenylyltransferase
MADVTAVVSIGTFDGIHLGHQAILTEVRCQAERRRITSLAYAFGLPPRLQAEEGPGRNLLLPESVKVRTLLRMVDRVVRASFPDIRDLSPAEFAVEILGEQLHADSVVVGPSFRFGARRVGDPETLQSLGKRLGFSVTVVPPVLVGGHPVNSTRIRSLLYGGDVAGAAALLGRPPVLIGRVAFGDRVGRTLGYPTANLAVDPYVLLPRHGVYVVRAFLGDSPDSASRSGVLYLGTRPTLRTEGGEPRCEVHLLTPPEGDLYGERIEVHLLERLRGDRSFACLEDLRLQIEQDTGRAGEILARFLEPSAPISS